MRDYSIDYIRTRCLDVINNQYKTVSQQAKKREWPISVLVPDLTELFPHLYLDEDYELFGYYAREYHGLFGEIAAVKKGNDHTASVEDFAIPIIDLPEEAVDPMEVIYCDGTGEGYFEAILLKSLISGLERLREYSPYGRELVSFREMDLSRWETIAEVSDWSIRFELSKKSCSMYLFEIDTVSFENAGQLAIGSPAICAYRLFKGASMAGTMAMDLADKFIALFNKQESMAIIDVLYGKKDSDEAY